MRQEQQDNFKAGCSKFVRTYSFVLQIGPFADIDLHKLYVYLNYLFKKLLKKASDGIDLADDVALAYYRNDKVFEGGIALDSDEDHKLKPTSFGAGSTPEEDKERLSSIIERLNDRFGTEFTDTDRLSYEQVKKDIVNNEDLVQKAKVNTKDNFKFSYEEAFLDIVIDRMSQNEKFFMKMMEDSDFKATVMNAMFDEIYHEMTGDRV